MELPARTKDWHGRSKSCGGRLPGFSCLGGGDSSGSGYAEVEHCIIVSCGGEAR